MRDLWYKSTEIVDDDGIPWVIEVAVADTAKPGGVWFGCNHAPAFDDPLGRTWLEEGDVCAEGVRSFLEEADIKPGSHHAVVVHVICAAAEFMDKGKVTLVVPDARRRPGREGTARQPPGRCGRRPSSAARTPVKAEQAEQRRREAAAREERKDEWTVKDAVYEVLREAKAAAGLIVAIRTLFYKVRPLVQKYTDKTLNYDYFSQTLVPEYRARPSSRWRACTTSRAASCTTPTTAR